MKARKIVKENFLGYNNKETVYKNSNAKIQMANDRINNMIYDLEERTVKFGEDLIEFTKKLEKNSINNPLISQAVRSGTSIGANYTEADCADSKKDFIYKISLRKKESKEICHWLRMIAKASLKHINQCRRLWQESHELTLIFSKIILSSKSK